MGLFSKKKIQEKITPELKTPLDAVIQMKQQRYSDNQIVQSLQKEGYSSTQIFDALSQADIKRAVPAQENYPEAPAGQGYPEPAPQFQQPPMPQAPLPLKREETGAVEKEQIEEVAETIIDEKWEELMKGVDKIISWKELTEERLVKIEQNIEELKKRFSELHTGILGKISDYDQGIRNVGTEVKAMQEVFKKTLPRFTENIAELSKITKKIKTKKP